MHDRDAENKTEKNLCHFLFAFCLALLLLHHKRIEDNAPAKNESRYSWPVPGPKFVYHFLHHGVDPTCHWCWWQVVGEKSTGPVRYRLPPVVLVL
jgi:hypothetical protein